MRFANDFTFGNTECLVLTVLNVHTQSTYGINDCPLLFRVEVFELSEHGPIDKFLYYLIIEVNLMRTSDPLSCWVY